MPNILTETYGASTSFTLILSVLLLFLNIVAVSFIVFIYRKLGRNEVKTVLLMGILALPLAVALIFYESMPMAVATVLMIVITMAFYSAGQIILINYPQRFYSYGLTAMIGGLINCFAAVGNVVASYGGGFIADNFGWRVLIVIWVVLIAVFVILALIAFPVWRRFLANQK
jgi:predicted MFS family arabinose efflux permease